MTGGQDWEEKASFPYLSARWNDMGLSHWDCWYFRAIFGIIDCNWQNLKSDEWSMSQAEYSAKQPLCPCTSYFQGMERGGGRFIRGRHFGHFSYKIACCVYGVWCTTSAAPTMWLIDVFLICLFGQQWSSVAQRISHWKLLGWSMKG